MHWCAFVCAFVLIPVDAWVNQNVEQRIGSTGGLLTVSVAVSVRNEADTDALLYEFLVDRYMHLHESTRIDTY